MNNNSVSSMLNANLPNVDVVNTCHNCDCVQQMCDVNITQVKNGIDCSMCLNNEKDPHLRSSELDNRKISECETKNEISMLIKRAENIFTWANDVIKENNLKKQFACNGKCFAEPNYLLDIACFCKALEDDGFSQEFAKQTAYFRAKMSEENVFDGITTEVYNNQSNFGFCNSLDPILNKFKSFLQENGGNYSIVELFFFEQNGSSLSPLSTAIKTWVISQREKHWDYFFLCEGSDYEEKKCAKYKNISFVDEQVSPGFGGEENRKQMLNDFRRIKDEDWNIAINAINDDDKIGCKKIDLKSICISEKKGHIKPSDISSVLQEEACESFDQTFLMLYAYNQELLNRLQFSEELKTQNKEMLVSRSIDYKNFYNVFGLDCNAQDKECCKLQAKNTAIYESSSLGSNGEAISECVSHTIQFLIPLHRIFVSFFVSKEFEDERECLSITEGLYATISEKRSVGLYSCDNQENPSNLCKWTRKNLKTNVSITNTSEDVRELFLSVQNLIKEDGDVIDIIPFCRFLELSLDVTVFPGVLSKDEQTILKSQIKAIIIDRKDSIDESLLAVLITTLVQLKAADDDIKAAMQSIVENFVEKTGKSETKNDTNLFLLLTVVEFFDTFGIDITNEFKEKCFKSIIDVVASDSQNYILFQELFHKSQITRIYPSLKLIKFIFSNKEKFEKETTIINEVKLNILKLNQQLMDYLIGNDTLRIMYDITSSISVIIGGYNEAQEDVVKEIFCEILEKISLRILFQKNLTEEDKTCIGKIIDFICYKKDKKNFLSNEQKGRMFMYYNGVLLHLSSSDKSNEIKFLNSLMESFDIVSSDE